MKSTSDKLNSQRGSGVFNFVYARANLRVSAGVGRTSFSEAYFVEPCLVSLFVDRKSFRVQQTARHGNRNSPCA